MLLLYPPPHTLLAQSSFKGQVANLHSLLRGSSTSRRPPHPGAPPMHRAKTPSFEVTVARTQKCRERRAHYRRQQESRGLQVSLALGRPRLDLPLVARTAAECWWASQIPVWEACYQVSAAKRITAMADATIQAVESLTRAWVEVARAGALVAAAGDTVVRPTMAMAVEQAVEQAAVPAAEQAADPAADPAGAQAVRRSGPALAAGAGSASPGEWPLPPELTFLVMEKWLRAKCAWRSLACVSKATSDTDDHARAERLAAEREDAVDDWAAIRAEGVSKLLAAYWPKGHHPNT